jgi:hypothetical protein
MEIKVSGTIYNHPVLQSPKRIIEKFFFSFCCKNENLQPKKKEKHVRQACAPHCMQHKPRILVKNGFSGTVKLEIQTSFLCRDVGTGNQYSELKKTQTKLCVCC